MQSSYTPENQSAENFTIIVLPDTQGYSKLYPWIFDNQTQWIVDNVEALNIVFVTHLGDLVDQTVNITQWENANRSMSKLDNSIPWAVLPGNHDMFDGNLTNFNTYFGYERFNEKAWYGGAYNVGDNSNSYQLFSAGGTDYLILQLQYDPNDDILYWANEIIDTYPNRKVVVATHDYLMGFTRAGQRSDIGERIWHSLVKPHADQVFL
ncbi:MAG: metallophosphoesterase, partial [Candidatus Bathyarchaeota archaeon]|nr:metallophosphoesterase [Candidatus Bathyarchaeota archaeon]